MADDDEKFLHLVSEALIEAGYDVRAVSHPEMVVDIASTYAPDLVILDISMPGKTGFEVARDLRANAKTAHIRSMFVTGHRSSTHVKEAKESGGIAYLEKPFKNSSLLWMVKSLLAKKPSEDAP